MNIFALHPDPTIAASMHCDQHLHKMILESAQMLSSIAAKLLSPKQFAKGCYYLPTHENHPCTLWIGQSLNNASWLIHLCSQLEAVRISLGLTPHRSMQIVLQFHSDVSLFHVKPCTSDFIFCGPDAIKSITRLDEHQKYQEFYKLKAEQWRREGKVKMSYKNRQVPEFIAHYIG